MDLDRPEKYRSVDKSGMIDRILGCPEQIREAEKLVDQVELPPRGRDEIESVVVTGMGGSGIPGDFLRVILGPSLPVPLVVSKDYDLPKFVGPRTLVLAISYSGDTEETIAAFHQAVRGEAKMIAITGGGELARLCHKHNVPTVLVPAGSQTRAVFGYLLLSSLVVFERLGLARSMRQGRREAATVAEAVREELHPSVPTVRNPAKQMARSLTGRFPVIYGARNGSEVAALRWRQQFNENSKMLAHHEAFPEMHHNEIAVWQAPQSVGGKIGLVFLRDQTETDQTRGSADLTRAMFEQRDEEVMEVWSKGKSLLARLFSQSYVGDFVSYYLALLRKVDPTPVEAIAFLRSELSKRRAL